MSTQGYLFDALSRHQLFVQRLASGHVRESLPVLRKLARELRAALLLHDLTSFQTARITALQLEINAITKAAGVALEAQTVPALQDFAAYEAQFTQKMLQGAVTLELAGVNTSALTRAVATTPMSLISGKKTITATMADVFDTFAAGTSREVMTAVQAGITRGATTKEIANEVFALANTRTKAQAETVIRTAANHAGSVARAETYRANADVLKGEEWSSVIDGRVTDVCMSRDGQIYKIGEGPHPPAHYNCRSVRIPLVDDAFKVLRTGSTRASMNGPISSQTTYNSWLKQQPASFQDEVLGNTKAKLFRSGGLSLQKFVDDSGKSYTLDQLRALEPMAFERAGL